MSKPKDLVQGTLDLLILKIVALEPMHGWAIAQRLKQMSNDVLQVNQGSLYPALHKLEQQGWIQAEWGDSENNRRAKFYSLTKSGRKAMDEESAQWERLAGAISFIVRSQGALLLLFALTLSLVAQTRKYTDAEVEKIHRSFLLIDTHNDITSQTVQGFDIASNSATTHTDAARLRKGNVGATFFAVYVAASYVNGNKAAHRALEMIDTVKRDIAAKHPDDFELAVTADAIEAARKHGRMAALMGIEGGHAIEDSLRLLGDFYDLGIRYMTLTHSNNNNWADSSGDTPKHNGLTDFGRNVVLEMNRLGMMVDISHVADKTFWDALETSRAPIFASHSSCRALSRIPRNMTDDMIKALAKKGGVVQINFGCDFLSQKSADTKNSSTKVRATLADVVAHIDHIVKLAGVDYVGIGSDFDGVTCVPEGLDDVSKFPNLTRALLEKGYMPGDIAKIYSGNLLRVMRAVERTAQGMH